MKHTNLLLFSLIFLGLATPAQAADINAASCSNTDIQTAIDAASDGDTVTVPAGTCNWGAQVTIPDTKGITLQGAGIDSTIISGALLRINMGTAPTQITRVTGFTFNASIAIRIWSFTSSKTQEFRIDNNKFNTASVWATCRCYGVIDHNIFTGASAFTAIRIFEAAYDLRGGGVFADGGGASWARDHSLGSRDAVFVEDNTISLDNPAVGSSCLDGRSGGRAVFRYNNITNQVCVTHDAEIGKERGMRQYEVYNNTFTYTGNIQGSIYNHRGGTGIVADNRFKLTNGAVFTQTGKAIILRISRGSSGTSGTNPWGSACNGTTASNKICIGAVPKMCSLDADCTGDFTGICLRMDGAGPEGNLCRDQIGAGKDDPITGVQAVEPYYFWGNTTCSTAGVDCIPSTPITSLSVADADNTPTQLQEGRDFFIANNTPKPGYSKFTYPHPLTSGTVVRPDPPTNLGVIVQ